MGVKNSEDVGDRILASAGESDAELMTAAVEKSVGVSGARTGGEGGGKDQNLAGLLQQIITILSHTQIKERQGSGGVG